MYPTVFLPQKQVMRKPIGASTDAASKVLLKVYDQGTQTWYLVDTVAVGSTVPTSTKRCRGTLLPYDLVAL